METIKQESPDILVRLAIAVESMRDAQKKYFKTRAKDDLIASKNLEREVDLLVKKFKEAQDERN